MWREAAQAHARQEYPKEACGLVISDEGKVQYVPCANVAKDAEEHFAISARAYAAAEEAGDVIAVFHSHPDVSSEPSEADITACEASGLAWHILSVPDGVWNGCTPSALRQPLIGRQFEHGGADCYGLVRDYYMQERGVYLPDFQRADEWWKHGGNLYAEFYSVAGFSLVEDGLQVGDVIIMKVQSRVPNHAAVYLGDDQILHHLHGQLSRREPYSGAWRRMTWGIVRHEGSDA